MVIRVWRNQRRHLCWITIVASLLSGCTTDGESPSASVEAPSSAIDAVKPDVSVPGAEVESLGLEELRAGEGRRATDGDWLVVDYVGVRALDGEEFTSSYEASRPRLVRLGSGYLIDGLEKGLEGVQAGGRYQLDIPAALAYGPKGLEERVPPGASVTFVVDVYAVIPRIEQGQAPVDVVSGPLEPVEALVLSDLVKGEGTEANAGDLVVVNLIAYRSDTGAIIDSSWEREEPVLLVLDSQETIPGLAAGIVGMQVGGRRLIRVPAEQAFGPDGNRQLGLPDDVDLAVVIDLLAVT